MMGFEPKLPDWDFVGGSTQSRTFQLAKQTGEEYDMKSGTAQFDLCEYVNGGAPVVTKTFGVVAAASGKFCVVSVALTAAETKALSGCYTYQIQLKDGNGNVAIPFHGRMHVAQNIAAHGK